MGFKKHIVDQFLLGTPVAPPLDPPLVLHQPIISLQPMYKCTWIFHHCIGNDKSVSIPFKIYKWLFFISEFRKYTDCQNVDIKS